MRSGYCPKCKTPTVYRMRDGIGEGGKGVYVRTSWMTKPSPVESFVCTRCGYYENYIVDDAKMVEVTQAWEKVV